MSLSRQELLGILRELGVQVTERQLRYWAEKNLIPKPSRIGQEVYYPAGTLNDILLIHQLKQVDILLKKHKDELTQILIPKRSREYVEAICRENEVQDRTG